MTKVITDNQQLTSTFIKYCKIFDKISFVTAWAGRQHPVIDALFANKQKIFHSVVGLQFYQTSPEFIERFESIDNIRYDKRQSTDVFHPKVYLFYSNDNSKWAVLIGSSNLTGGGFGRNVECNVLLNSETDSTSDFNAVQALISRSWKKAEPMGDFFDDYSEHAKAACSALKPYKKPANPVLCDLDWDDYISRLIQNQDDDGIISDDIRTRLALLDKAQELFAKYSLIDFPDEYASAVAGLMIQYENIDDWQFFGSTTANGKFRSNFKSKYCKGISKALDVIPLTGDVSEDDFNRYVQMVRKATNFKNPLTICTRFLAMKRPGIFVCAAGRTGENGKPSTIKKLCTLLGLKRATISIDNYWELVVATVQNSTWYSTDIDEIPAEQQHIYKYRAAMLDALYY
jgi:hypothetical protein